MKPGSLRVRSGSTEIDEGEIHKVLRIDQHPKYNNINYDFDFAILTVDRIYFNERQKPIVMVEDKTETPLTGDSVRVLGWGNTMNLLVINFKLFA
jgi:hypothetical protein